MTLLLFGNLFSILTFASVAALVVFIALAVKNRDRIHTWGRLLLLFILIGTAVSAFSALRDGYATKSALFEMHSIQSIVCSVAGGTIFLIGLLTLFLKKQAHRKVCFYTVSALFTIQVILIEASRFSMLL